MYKAQFAILFWVCLFGLQNATAVENNPKLIKVNYLNWNMLLTRDGQSGDLNSISFSLQNLADQPLEWVKLLAVVKGYSGDIIQTETIEQSLLGNRAADKPLGRRPIF
jgi:hypothetical protein